MIFRDEVDAITIIKYYEKKVMKKRNNLPVQNFKMYSRAKVISTRLVAKFLT